MSEREKRALQTLNAIARGEYPTTHTGGEWLRELARRKARELEQKVFERDARETKQEVFYQEMA